MLHSELFKSKMRLNPEGHIVTDANVATNVAEVFAVGEASNSPLGQVVTAKADGSIAAEAADRYIRECKEEVWAWKASA